MSFSIQTESDADQYGASSAGLTLDIVYSVERWRDGVMDFLVRDTSQMYGMGLQKEATLALLDDDMEGGAVSYGVTANVIKDSLVITRCHFALPIVSK